MTAARRAGRRAASTAFAIYLLAWKQRRVAATGSCSSASASPRCCRGVTQYLLTRAEIFEAQRAVVWLTGSLNGRGWEHVRHGRARRRSCCCRSSSRCSARCASCSSATTPPRASAWPSSAAAWLLVIVGVALAALATAAAGPVVFVAFVAAADRPPADAARRSPSAPSALVGALLVLLSDLVARRAVRARPSCPSASSPASSAPRTCCGCWPAPTGSGEEDDRWNRSTETAPPPSTRSRTCPSTTCRRVAGRVADHDDARRRQDLRLAYDDREIVERPVGRHPDRPGSP